MHGSRATYSPTRALRASFRAQTPCENMGLLLNFLDDAHDVQRGESRLHGCAFGVPPSTKPRPALRLLFTDECEKHDGFTRHPDGNGQSCANAQSRENCHDNTITVCYRLSRLTTWRRARVISFLCPATDGRPKRRAATTTTSRRNTGRSRRQLNRWRNLIGKRPRSSKLTRHPRSARGPGHNYSLFCRFSFCSSIRNLKIDAQKSDESEEKKKRLLEYLKTTDDLAFLFLHFFARTFKEYIS